MKFKPPRSLASIALVTAVCAPAAHAGLSHQVPVTVDHVEQFFFGSMEGARSADSPDSYLSCVVTAQSYGARVDVTAYCSAQDDRGFLAGCISTDAEFIDVVNSINGISYVSIDFGTAAYARQIPTCTGITVSKGSLFLDPLTGANGKEAAK